MRSLRGALKDGGEASTTTVEVWLSGNPHATWPSMLSRASESVFEISWYTRFSVIKMSSRNNQKWYGDQLRGVLDRQTDRQTWVSPMAERVQASVLGGCVGGLCGLLRAWMPEHQRQSYPGLEYLSSRCAAGCS